MFELAEMWVLAVVMMVCGALALWAIYTLYEWLEPGVRHDAEEDEHVQGLPAPWNRRKK